MGEIYVQGEKEIVNCSLGSDSLEARFPCMLTAQVPNEDPSHICNDSYVNQGDMVPVLNVKEVAQETSALSRSRSLTGSCQYE